MARVFAGERTFLDPVLLPIERLIYRLCGVQPATEQTWVEYTVSMLLFSVVGMVLLYAIERLQDFLPLNPQRLRRGANQVWHSTPRPASRPTPTGRRTRGESTMSYLTQMAGLAFHNFVSAAAGLAIAIAVIRGFVRRGSRTLGNFWFDLRAQHAWVLLPICIIFTVVLVWQGVPQNFSAYTQVKTIEKGTQIDRAGPGGVADSDQAARHQRRRFLQRQLGASVRKSHAAYQLSRDVVAIFAIGAA